jgi:predicted Zn finger-like uncharacterized protein
MPFGPLAAAPAPHGFRSINEGPLACRRSPLGHDSPMLITCTNCATSYQVAASSLGSSGRSVRCARCQHVWFAANTDAMADVAEAHRADLAAIAETPPDPAAPGPGFADAADAPPPVADADQVQGQAQDQPPVSDAGIDPPAWPEPEFVHDEAPPLIDAPPLAPTAPVPAGEDIESVAARRAERQAAHQRRWERSSWTVAILTLAAIHLMLIGWRTDVVRWLPQTASLYAAIGLPVNLRGLVFANVTTERETHEGVEVLVVEGSIVNDYKRAVEVPRLRFSVRNKSGHEVYSWTALPSRNALLPGESLPFGSRLASPPREADRVQVRFFSRRDLNAELP